MLKIVLAGWILMAHTHAYTNKLFHEDSPYLQQHAHNPVDWYPWGDEAFAKARKEHKLIFLSIGYSTCHWCHVMERESFENEAVAKILNKDYVSIKVDREEYPHIDRHYQDVFMLMHRSGGGWPLTIVMTPERKVFYSATYLPPDNRYGRAGLMGMLQVLDDAFKNKPEDVAKSVASIEAAIKHYESEEQTATPIALNLSIADTFVQAIQSQYDNKFKGIGTSPKFPHATTLDTLLDIYKITHNKQALTMATEALTAMRRGGIYDQIEGGFYRYSVDEMWMVPHFEKMLYTNAELLQTYANAYSITKDEDFKTVIKETIENISERFEKEGVYYSASDADSDDEEGKYFVFDYKQSLKDLIDGGFTKEDAKAILTYYSIYPEGNFEYKQTNPYLSGLDIPKNLAKGKKILRVNRAKKNYAFIDHKIQTSWNSLFISGLFQAGKYVDESYNTKAKASLDSLLKHLYIDGELYHQVILGKKPKVKGYLEDYAFLIAALLQSYEASYDNHDLELAKTLSDKAVMKFYQNGIWYMSDDAFKAKASLYDASYRSALAVMLENLFKIAILSDNLKLHDFAKKALGSQLHDLNNAPSQFPYALKVYLQSLLSNVVIKTTKENLLANKKALNAIKYPYTLTKPTEDRKFLACKIDSCFAIDQNLSKVIEKIEGR